jgi:hypothetical protein
MSRNIVDGTPRWAVVCAYATLLSVVPCALWRTSIGFGAQLGTTQAWRDSQDIPGSGTFYVISLSVLSIAAAALTLGLVRQWGEVVPGWVPGLAGRRVPTALVIVLAVAGAAAVMFICAMSAIHWQHLIGYAGRPAPGWYQLAVGAYLPALLWGPLLLTTTAAYWRRRTRTATATTGSEGRAELVGTGRA